MNKKKIIILSLFVVVVLINIFPLRPNYKPSTVKKDIQSVSLDQNYKDFYTGYMITSKTEFNPIQTSDDGYLITLSDFMGVGAYRSDSRDLISSMIKLDSNLEISWVVGGEDGILFEDHYIYIYKTTELNDGSFVGIGKATVSTNEFDNWIDYIKYAEGDLVLIKVDKDGNKVFTKLFNEYSLDDYDYQYSDYEGRFFTFNIVSTTDGGFTIITNNNKTDHSLLAHFDKDGGLIWHRLINIDDDNFQVSMISDEEDNYYLYGENYGVVYNINRIIKLSATGKLIWDKEYDYNIKNINILNNQLIISGSKSTPEIVTKSVKNFFFLKEGAKDADYSYGRSSFAITASVNMKSGKENWVNAYNLDNYNRFYSISSFTDDNKNIYSHTIIPYVDTISDILIKYDAEGNRIGEVIINSHYDNNWPGSYPIYITNNNNEIIIIHMTAETYSFINLDDLPWSKPVHLNYDYIRFYQNYLVFRVWINRLALLSIILVPLVIHFRNKRYLD